MAKKKKRSKGKEYYCRGISWKDSMFFSVLLFLLGFIVWAGEAGYYARNLIWSNVLMMSGILLAVKSVWMSTKE